MSYNCLNNRQIDIFDSSQTRLFKKNQIIYKEKEAIENIFIILDGLVESSSSKSLSDKFILHKGSSLGLIDVILERSFSRSMKARSIVSLAVVDKKNLKNILKSNAVAGVLIKSLAIDIDNKFPYIWS